ncbi:MAG: nucleotidyltransferase substrate binding protein, partial [Puniceicoccales bacterium]|nr:nucleotidyltransferase substrate binding protein [Puniceicoccales bacterium]
MDGEQIDHGKLRNALAALESNLCALGKDAVAKDEILKRAVSCGVVQAFEVAYEVARNFIAKRLSELWNREEVRKISKKDLFNRAEEFGIIPDAGCWYKFHV